jgi:hypothetical protein
VFVKKNEIFVKINFAVEKGSSHFWVAFVITPKLPKVNNHPIGKNSPNLVTLYVRAKTFQR